MALFKRGTGHSSEDHTRVLELTQRVGRGSPAPMKPQQLGPNQIKWLEERFRFYAIHRKQAEAPTGVAVIQSTPLRIEDPAS